jgi:peptide deformylase
MSILRIVTYPDPFLKQPTKPVVSIDDEIQQVIENMADTMYQAPGVGLAAVQAGIDKSIIIFDPEPDPEKRKFQALINPEIIVNRGATLSEKEGCLSVPDFRSDVERFERVVVRGMDREGKPVEIDTDGILAVILQHEIDHLNGILFIDRISALKRKLYQKKRKKALAQGGKTV